ncbi:phytoene desaturase family protein [Paenibacillus campi]|uniref:phytoene desaturase family protein n=1 Tax=Paenibacillus campi TaxID=3106031 RepID=UPI002AFECE5A|nr:phytoene desaturase family protein [Paenibacillus sp. SGZ-1014]
MRRKRIAIVGGGIGGLTAALLLSQRDVDVTIFEKSDRLGGRIAFEQHDGMAIDQGPTIVLLPEMLHSIMEEGGISRERLPLIECDPLYRIHYADGRVMTKHRGIEQQTEELERLFPGSGVGFRRFMHDMRPLFARGQASFLERDFPNASTFFSRSNLALMRSLRAYRNLSQAAGIYFRQQQLREAYSLQSLYIGGIPEKTPGLYTMLPYAEHAFGVWMLQGGYATLPRIIGEELHNRGVTIRLNCTVNHIEVRNGVCLGIQADGEKLPFDAVLYNGDFPFIYELLTDSQPALKRQRRPYQPSSGCVLIYAGTDRRWDDKLAHQFFLPDDLNASLRQTFGERKLPVHPSVYVFNPVALDPQAAPAGQSALYFLVPVTDEQGIAWEHDTGELVERVLALVEERGWEGLRTSITWKKVRTPVDAKRSGLYGGGSFGIAPIIRQSGAYRPQPRPFPSIRRLYAAGASVHPGGGVPIVMQGARMAAQQMLKELGI